VAGAFVAKSEPPLAGDEFVPEALNAKAVVKCLVTVVVALVIAECMVRSRPEAVEFTVLAMMALSPSRLAIRSVVFVLGGVVEETLAELLKDLEES